MRAVRTASLTRRKRDRGYRFIRSRQFEQFMHKALEKAELRRIRIHDLRHTYATLRIAKGDSIADVSNQLGHHLVKLTMDVYYHWIPGKKKSEVDALDDPSFIHPPAPHMHPDAQKTKKGLRFFA
jgi:integrase